MKNWRVLFEVFKPGQREIKSVVVEAGNKRIAVTRAMAEINKLEGYSDLFKKVYSIEEAA